MAFIPQGSYTMGVGGQDIASTQITQPKTISVSSFYMDETEITNNEYREFVNWVRDSIARKILGEGELSETYLITQDPKTGELYDVPVLNWDEKIDWTNEELVEELFIPEAERFFGKKEIDTRKLYYEYYWIDLQAAARKDFQSEANYQDASFANRSQGMRDRSVFIKKEMINVYPDTLAWVYDYAHSFNDPLTEKYFWHVAYDHYPVVGVNWNQAKAFCIWRTEKLNKYLKSQKDETAALLEYRLPTEAEWEWAARGGNHMNPYPWGGPYTRNDRGCFLANFKPLRGNYIADGALRTTIVGHYPPNDWGLYDMAGNVAEWTNSAYDPLSYNTWDINPNYTYNAKATDPAIMKRKVIRGGSWKDIAYYLEVTTRTYEYQDTAKCYIGFRCVQPFLGRNEGDNMNKASRVY
jgi:gliding motility-associated lipoprotein GldK